MNDDSLHSSEMCGMYKVFRKKQNVYMFLKRSFVSKFRSKFHDPFPFKYRHLQCKLEVELKGAGVLNYGPTV